MNKINFKQPKYIIPLITLPFALFLSFTIADYTKTDEKTKVEEISKNLGSDDQIEDIYDKEKAYDNAFQLQKDQGTAIGNLDHESDSLAFYRDNLTDAQRRELDSLQAIKRMQRQMQNAQMQRERVQNDFYNPSSQGRNYARQTEQREERDYQRSMQLLQALNSNANPQQESANYSEAKQESAEDWRKEQLKLMRQQMILADSMEQSKDPEFQRQAFLSKQNADNAKKKKFYLNSTLKVSKTNSNTNFNSFYKDGNQSFIKAVIDQNIKGYMGSRLKLRLEDDIYVGNVRIERGTPLFALITGFDSQRVKLSIVSVLYKNQILPINLSIYDNDGMEGLYVPASMFREMTQEMGQNMVQGQPLNSANADFFTTMLSGLYQSTSRTIADIIRKNKVKIKYNTHIYLIDNSVLDKKREEIYKNAK